MKDNCVTIKIKKALNYYQHENVVYISLNEFYYLKLYNLTKVENMSFEGIPIERHFIKSAKILIKNKKGLIQRFC